MLSMVENAYEWAATQVQRYRVHKQFRLHMGKDGDFSTLR